MIIVSGEHAGREPQNSSYYYIVQVSLPADKVKVIIAEILNHKKETSNGGSASKRMSEKKLKVRLTEIEILWLLKSFTNISLMYILCC